MSNIDDVIARAQQPGGFSEQQQFTVARERAIRKMREFALADPHYYILELIQAAVANGATHVHIDVRSDTLQFSYIGGGYSREELAQLFDYLFASKESLEHSAIRQLAVGVNAMMMLEPSRIVIESGAGTLESTDRIVIREDNDTVEVGTPDQSLRGTFIRAEGFNRSAIGDKSNLDPRAYGPPECSAIEQRCLAAPVPIIVNNEPVFGYSSLRTPVIFGYNNVVTFDEGDLYGSIGKPRHRHKGGFKILTWGCWIESTEAAKMDDQKIGGVVCYDRLNKTADHSGIVRDRHFEELWARLRPYANQVYEGREGKGDFSIQYLGGAELPEDLAGDELSVRQLRELYRAVDRVVVTTLDELDGEEQRDLADRVGRALNAPVLKVAPGAFNSVAILAGTDAELLRPNLSARGDLSIYYADEAAPPARPWLTGKVDLEPIEVEAFGEMLVAEESVSETQKTTLVEHLDKRRQIKGTIYTPTDTEEASELHVRVKTLGRIVWEGPVRSPFPGHVLDIELPPVAPSHLQQTLERADASYAELIAEVVAGRAIDKLQQATLRSLESLAMSDQRDSETGRRIALAALGRTALKRLREKDGEPGPEVHFSLLRSQPGPDLLAMPVFDALDGTSYSLRDLEQMMEHTGGLVYGAVPEVEPNLEGLDRSRILDLDLERERQLLSIVGEAAYVRIDQRDILAESDGFRVRDMAIGLQQYPEFPLLVEGADPSDLEAEAAEELTGELVDQLQSTYADDGRDTSIRREAVRHLQWFVCRRTLTAPEAPTYGVEQLPLFLDGHGNPVTFEAVRQGLRTDRGIEMIDGRSSDVCELGSVTGAGGSSHSDGGAVTHLTMNTWVYQLLSAHGRLRGAFDFDFTDDEAAGVDPTPEEAFLEETTIDADAFSGQIGIPHRAVDTPTIAVVDTNKRTYRMREPTITYGLTGYLQVEHGDVRDRWSELRTRVADEGKQVLSALADEIPELDPDGERFRRSFEALFGFAARHLQMTRAPDGTIELRIEHPLAQKILELPLFPTRVGNPVSALRLLREFCLAQSADALAERIPLTDDLADPLRDWLDRHLTRENIVAPADSTTAEVDDAPAPDTLADRVQYWLAELRPDDVRTPPAGELGDLARDAYQTTVLLAEPGERTAMVEKFGDGDLCGYMRDTTPNDQTGKLWLNPNHPLVRRADSDDRAFAWLLLGAYAHINDLLEPVTNDHELEFQRRVADALDEL